MAMTVGTENSDTHEKKPKTQLYSLFQLQCRQEVTGISQLGLDDRNKMKALHRLRENLISIKAACARPDHAELHTIQELGP